MLLARIGAVLVVAVLAVLVVIGRPVASVPTASAVPSPPPAPPPSAAPWDLDADIGSVMVFSWRGALPSESVMPVLADKQVGGVLLYAANFGGDQADLKALTDRLQALVSPRCSAHPILVMLDQEGGDLTNVKDLTTPWPHDMAQAGPDKVRSFEQANAVGLAAAGVGLDLAPVADVRTNPRDAVIGYRSFGSSPSVVAPSVAAAVQGLHDGGVGATLKHFPGLGGAPGDPHVAIPTDPESEATWRAVQLPGFKAGIDAGADAVMVTAVYTPGLGSGTTPALFSRAIINRLRNELAFQGVIVADSLTMWGIGQKWSLPEAAVLALSAGNDMLLLGNGDPALEVEAIAAVKSAVQSGRLDRTRLHESAMRVNALRDHWGRSPAPCSRPLTA